MPLPEPTRITSINCWPNVRALVWPLFITLTVLLLLGIIVPFYAGGGQFLPVQVIYGDPSRINTSNDPLFALLTVPFGGTIFVMWGYITPPLALGLLSLLPFQWRKLSNSSRAMRLSALLFWALMLMLALPQWQKLTYWVVD